MKRVLVSTVFMDRSNTSCYIVPFCVWTKTFSSSSLFNISTGVITNNDTYSSFSACEHVSKIEVDSKLKPVITSMPTLDMIYLAKWTTTSLLQYDAIVHFDLDIDFFNMYPFRQFETSIDAFLTSDTKIAGSADWACVLNTGAMMFRPSREKYERGLALLRTKNFDPKLGFNKTGSPIDVWKRFSARNLSAAAQHSRMFRHNTWKVPGGNADQGLFALLYVFEGSVLYKRLYPVRHFWWVYKPHSSCRRWIENVHAAEPMCANQTINWNRTVNDRCMKHKQYIG